MIEKMMRLIAWFTMGFLLPALLVSGFLVWAHVLNDWSGNSPLNHIYWIPIFYLAHLLLSVAYFVIFRRHAKNSKYIFIAGIVGGLSLLLLPHQTAFIFSGLEIPMMLMVGACMTALLWLSTKM